jgi:multimeric flavodoxin WrbA
VRGLTHENFVDKAENEKINLRKIIEEVIKTDNCSDPNYKYDPYNNIYPEWVKIQFNV